jgi:hypothetical protein
MVIALSILCFHVLSGTCQSRHDGCELVLFLEAFEQGCRQCVIRRSTESDGALTGAGPMKLI